MDKKIIGNFREDFDSDNRFIKQECVKYNNETYFVSTVDLGINHNFFNEGDPIYWETMIFAMDDDYEPSFIDLYIRRYTSLNEAIENHNKIVQAFKYNTNELEFSVGYFEFKWENINSFERLGLFNENK